MNHHTHQHRHVRCPELATAAQLPTEPQLITHEEDTTSVRHFGITYSMIEPLMGFRTESHPLETTVEIWMVRRRRAASLLGNPPHAPWSPGGPHYHKASMPIALLHLRLSGGVSQNRAATYTPGSIIRRLSRARPLSAWRPDLLPLGT